MLLVHRRDVVEPVEIRDRLQIGLVLDQLLGAAMQQADVRIDPLDDLAVELEHEAQHAVRGRMLRPEVDGEVAEVLGHQATPAFCGLVGDAGVELVPRHDEALVTALADHVDAVMGLDVEHALLAVHLDALAIHRHGHARRRRRRMADVDVDAEAALARIEMRRHQLDAGPLHQHDHEAGREHLRHRRDLRRFRIGVRHRLALRHDVGEAMRQPGLEGRLHAQASPSILGLLVAGQRHVARALPRREEIEIAEFLGEPHLVVDHALLLVVVAHLDEAGQREILAQRMALEAVVGEQPPHVGMAGEQHAVEIVGLALEPSRRPETPR